MLKFVALEWIISIPTVHMLRGKRRKCSFITDWAQRVNAPYSLFHIETFVDPDWIRVILSSFLLKPPSGAADEEEEEEEVETVSLLPRKPHLAYLTPFYGDVTNRNGPLTAGDSKADGTWLQERRCVASPHTAVAWFVWFLAFVVALPLGGGKKYWGWAREGADAFWV